jgi:hypothetical protein
LKRSIVVCLGIDGKKTVSCFRKIAYISTMKDKQTSSGTPRSRKRQSQVDAGAYDGRFRTRAVQDRKAEEGRKACRGFKPEKGEWL